MVLLDRRTPGTSREIYGEDADDGTGASNPSVINQVLYPLSYTAHKLLLRRS